MSSVAASSGVQSMVAPLWRVLLKHARTAYRDAAHVAASWQGLGYSGCPDLDVAIRQYEAFLDLIRAEVPSIEFLEDDARAGLDSIYAYDPVIVTERGAILCRMGKAREWLIEHGYTLLDVPDDEHGTLACNVLALAPRRCMLVAGNPVTRRMLLEAGAAVIEYEGSEISLKGGGGPTCLTRPILRSENA